MSWMAPEYIMRIFEKENELKLTAREINERLDLEGLASSSLNKHLRKLTGPKFGFSLGRYMEKGRYVYYNPKNSK